MTVTLPYLPVLPELVAELRLLPFVLRLLVALLVFLVGRLIAKILVQAFSRVMERSRLDLSLRKFLGDLLYAIAIVAVIIAALDTIGIDTTVVIAVLGAAGLAIGLALQGSLSNFAAGVMLIVLRPYKVGDLVAIDRYVGRVEAIKVFHTVLVTGDYREITIPNAQIIAKPIENLTVLGRRRVELVVSVNQATELQRVRHLLEGVLLADRRIQAAPPPTVEVAEITADSVKLHVRPWTTVEHFAQVATETMERIRDAMTAADLRFSVTLLSAT